MKQMQIKDFFTKKRKNISNESNHKRRRSNDQQRISEDSSDLFSSNSDSSSNSGTIANESLDRLDDTSQKSEGEEIDTCIETNPYTDPESVVVCDVDPNIVNEIRSESSQNKEKKQKNTSIGTVNKKLLKHSMEFIVHTIGQYNKHLKPSDAFKGILTDESRALLSTLALESENNKELVSYLFCAAQYEPEGIADVDFPNKTLENKEINYNCTSLYERGLITFYPKDADVLSEEQCTKLLKLSETQEAADPSKKNLQEKKKRKIIAIQLTRDIKDFLNDVTDDKKSLVLKKLRSKVKKWKLSDLARETITELTVLMHLDNIFKMGGSIDFTRVYNDRPVLSFKPSGNSKLYPVDMKMILDNATIIFQDRKEFCDYLNALALSEEYKAKEAEDKREFVLRVYQLYRDVNKENMSHYRALPLWLRRFTPINFYVDILEDGVNHLKKSKEYNRALEILDLLIAQVAFKQENKANWYDTKALIQLKCLKSPEKAARTLYEAFDASLPEETVMSLRHRAKQILETTTRSQIDQKILHVLQVNAESEILERSIPGPCFHYQESAEKSNSRRRPKYKWKNELVSAETLCCNISKNEQSFTLVEHWEGNLMKAIYFILFWDIIYTKPLAIGGIFLSHYQQYPLDMWCENFYINRKARIDDFLAMIQNSTVDDIMKMITNWYHKYLVSGQRGIVGQKLLSKERPMSSSGLLYAVDDDHKYKLDQYDLPEMTRKVINCNNIEIVVRCLGPRALATICRRLAHNYNYMRYGFPDLTLCNTDNYTIEFREVKTNDSVRPNQIQWLHYLNVHNIKAGFFYLTVQKEQDIKQEAANENSINSSYPPDANNEDPRPGPSTSLA